MTVLHVYNLYDSTIESYIAQFFNTHDKLMKRECENIYENAKKVHLTNPTSPQGSLYRYADSYLMIHTAEFDDQTGRYTNLEVPVTICNFGYFYNQEKEKENSLPHNIHKTPLADNQDISLVG